MKNSKFMNNMSRKLHMAGLKLRKHSPEILLVTGVVGTVASTVMACKASTKVRDILDAAKTDIEVIHESVENGQIVEVNEEGNKVIKPCTEEDSKKYLAGVYVKTGVQFAKLYAPAVTVGAVSIACILASHNIIHKRNVALTAAYATIDKNFKEYRNRVIDRFGKELDRELRFNVKPKEVEEVVVDENGNESVVKTTIHVPNIDEHSEYARCFDEYCTGWRNDNEYNRKFLIQMQAWANNKLQTQGYLYLNDVYEMLGFPKSKAGQVVGWIYDKSGNGTGDNYVDFGIYEFYREKTRDFYNLRETSIWLDFNVDGNIWELMS